MSADQPLGLQRDVCSLPFFHDVLAATRTEEEVSLEGRKSIQPLICASDWAAIAASKLFMEQMMGSTRQLPNLVLCQVLVHRPPQPHLQQPISRLLSLTKPTVPPSKKRVTEKAMMNPPPDHHPCQLLVMKIVRLANRPAMDSPRCPPPCHH